MAPHTGKNKAYKSSDVLPDLLFPDCRNLAHAFMAGRMWKSLVIDMWVFYTGLYKNKKV